MTPKRSSHHFVHCLLLTIGSLLIGIKRIYRQFLAITRFLAQRIAFPKRKQSRAFARGFQPDLWNRIASRLQLKLPIISQTTRTNLDDIHEAARYVLHGTPSTILMTPYKHFNFGIFRPHRHTHRGTNKERRNTATSGAMIESFMKRFLHKTRNEQIG